MSESRTPFIVFGCGLPRTGTLSISKALEQLLGGKCHHGYTVVFENGREHLDFWMQFSKSKDLEDMKEFLSTRGYSAGIDAPFSYYYKEMLEAYPGVKVLLTVRDPKSWFKSYQHFLTRFYSDRKKFPLSLLDRFHDKGDFTEMSAQNLPDLCAAVDKGEEAAINCFNEWNERIKEDVPANQLLVYDVSDGWEPLCKFLNVPVPDCPFPHLNSTASIGELARQWVAPVERIFIALLSIFMVGLAFISYDLFGAEQGMLNWYVAMGTATVLVCLCFLLILIIYQVRIILKAYFVQ